MNTRKRLYLVLIALAVLIAGLVTAGPAGASTKFQVVHDGAGRIGVSCDHITYSDNWTIGRCIRLEYDNGFHSDITGDYSTTSFYPEVSISCQNSAGTYVRCAGASYSAHVVIDGNDSGRSSYSCGSLAGGTDRISTSCWTPQDDDYMEWNPVTWYLEAHIAAVTRCADPSYATMYEMDIHANGHTWMPTYKSTAAFNICDTTG